MKTELLAPRPDAIEKAAGILRAGGLVAIPTETVYGLAANALDGAAVSAIFAAKGRPQDNPLISHIASMDMLGMVAGSVPPQAQRLAEAFWPGPLTMVLPRGAAVAREVCAGLETAAVRMPSHPVAQAVIRAAGVPLAAPSANLSGSPSPTTAQDVLADMDGRVPLILDGGACEVGVESTVVSLAGPSPVLLRPGGITKEQLEAVLGCEVQLAHAVLHGLREGEKAASPGMKYKHYAPKAEVTLVKGPFRAYCDYVAGRAGPGVFALCYEGEETELSVPAVTYGRRESAASQAHALFGALRELDRRGARTVYARCPQMDGMALAVYNRILRAAALGADILDEAGRLRRGLLARRAFATKEDARRLTDITHPEIVRRLLAGVAKAKAAGAALVFVDGAVIVGAPFEPFCDAIIVVRAPQHVLEQRIVQRDGVSLAAARARLGSQLAQEKLDAAATYILENKESEQALLAQAQTVLENLLKEGMT